MVDHQQETTHSRLSKIDYDAGNRENVSKTFSHIFGYSLGDTHIDKVTESLTIKLINDFIEKSKNITETMEEELLEDILLEASKLPNSIDPIKWYLGII